MTTKRSITRQNKSAVPTQSENSEKDRPPFTGLQVVLVINDQVAGTATMPLAATYAESERRLQELASSIRDTLARLYEDQLRQVAEGEKQRADALERELAALKAEKAQEVQT